MSTLETFTQSLASLLRAGDVDLPDLDLDELAALLPADGPSMPPVPTLGDPVASQRGRRRLQERGLLDEEGLPDSDIELLLALRRFPGSILIVEAGASKKPIVRCYLGFANVGFLEETVDDGTSRHFAVRSAASTLACLTQLCNPGNVNGQDGPLERGSLQSDLEPWCSLDRVDSAARLNVTTWTGDDSTGQVAVTIVVIGDRIWSLSDLWQDETLALPLSRAGLRDLLRRFVSTDSVDRR